MQGEPLLVYSNDDLLDPARLQAVREGRERVVGAPTVTIAPIMRAVQQTTSIALEFESIPPERYPEVLAVLNDVVHDLALEVYRMVEGVRQHKIAVDADPRD